MNAQTLSGTSVHRLHCKMGWKEFGSGCLLLFFFSISALADTHYVSLSGSHTAPFTDWLTAATDIQAAIDVASGGDTVLVSNGVYAAGGAFAAGMTNRVAITNAVTVRSANGPDVTIIQGQGPMGSAAIRCAHVADGTKLVGFTLTKGFTQTSIYGNASSGGGIYCDSAAGIVSNCMLIGNSAYYDGGGARYGTLNNCTLTGNAASHGGGAYYGTLYNCTLTENSASWGGGAYNGMLNNCTLTGNSARYGGGGASGGTLYNCTLTGNSADYYGGGGAYDGTLYNCTLTGNSARSDGGGTYYGTLYNCTLTENSASFGGGGTSGGTLYNCTLTGNSAGLGGGAYDGTFYNCTLTENSASYGGGAYDGTLYNCTLTGNSASSGGGASYGTLYNCIVYYNIALEKSNYSGGTLNYCCTLPMPSFGGGNFTSAPRLAGLTNPHLTQGSPCIDAGRNAYVFTATDFDGEARTNGTTVDVGCDEFWADSCTGTLRVAILTPVGTSAVTGYPLPFQVGINGYPLTYVWRFGDGALTTNETVISHAYESPGEYSVVLEAANLSGSMSATVTVRIASLSEATRYVATNGNDAADGLSWATAKATIQAGIDVTIPGGLVLVSNGVYATGGAFAAGMMNRIVITNALTVQSMNEPKVTMIEGQGPMGESAVRCAYVADGAKLIGFTLTNGFTQESYESSDCGGGIYCESAAGIVSNCTLTGNSARYGGGTYYGTLYNCTLTENSASFGGGGASGGTLYNWVLTGNSASYGGGASGGTLHNCTLTGNSASDGGGAYKGTLYNCAVYYNTAPQNPNCSSGTLNYCCTLPMPSSGVGNFTNAPGLAGLTNPHLTQGSPCLDAGRNAYVFTATDLDGEARTNGTMVDVGCDEFWADSCTGTLQVAILTLAGTNAATGYPLSFQADIGGRPLTYVWRFGDGASTTNAFLVSHAYASAGEYSVVLEAANLSGSVSATVTVQIVSMAGATRYVSTNGNDAADGMSWATAKATIQAGIDVANPGGLVLVSNGVYATGGAFAAGVTNRIVITKALTVQSMNGPKVTMIEGQGPMGESAVRCAYVADGAKLVGFTLTKGFTRTSYDNASSGGGIYCDSAAGIVSNCILTGNSANYGGGSFYGTLYNCVLVGNSAASGAGAWYSTLYNCTLTGNSASYSVGGARYSTLYNCIVYYNTAQSHSPNWLDCTLNFSCTTPRPGGMGNISDDPHFVNTAARDYHLQSTSPCINSGINQRWMIGATDLDGNPRLYAGGVDMGAYEYQGMSVWPNTTAPIVVDAGPDSAVELGVKFKSDVAGIIKGIRFYKAAANTGAHIGNLWTSDGTRLATVTFSNETASGWQEAFFATPVAIASNTVYVASYHANNGHYSADLNYFFGKGVDNPPLHMLTNGVFGGNGVYAYGSSNVFPNQTYKAANYWVDVMFTAGLSTLTSITVTPANLSIIPGASQQFVATGNYSDGSTRNVTSQAMWTSSNPTVATINSSGRATALSAGSTTISATLASVTGSSLLTVQSAPAVLTIWPNTAIPQWVDSGPDNAVALGVKFNSDVAGTITGIRFYKAVANTGAHIGNLWTTNGTRLATVIFSNETTSGWQQALFATPVTITSNTVYVASYHANNGHYSCDVNYFSEKGVDNPPLHALAHGVSGGNGVYCYDENSLFPNQTWNAANYWVDVVFQPTSLPPPLMSLPLMAAGKNVERWPWVWTSGDFSKECGASNLIDGDTNTLWIGNVGGEPWRVILDLGAVTDVTGIQLMFQDIAWTNQELIGSRDSEVWFDYLAETNEWVPLRYLYVDFWGNEHGAQPPAIREIIWRDR